jgi:hypothetical protein
MIISPQDAIQLPLHDALVLGMSITPTKDGFVTATLNVKVNHEELVHPLRELGITTSELCLVFGDCWQVITNLMGYCSAPEVMSTFDIIEASELKQKLRSFGVGSATMIHFRIQGSSGSQLDFVAETFSVVGRN